jgi:putative ABC transport system permease protein
MFRNYIQTALKAFANKKIYSFVNVFGLTVGLSACMIVATVVIDDLSYDRQWSRSKDLYRIISEYKLGAGLYDRSSSSFAGLKDELQKNFPEVEAAANIMTDHLLLKFNGSGRPDGVSVTSLETDTAVWNMLDIKVISGNPRTYVDGQNNLLISESIRDKFFPGRDPVGTIIYDMPTYGEKPTPYLITGIIRDLPANTHLRAEVIQLKKGKIVALSHQNAGYFRTQYLLMKPGTDMKRFSALVNSWYNHFITKDNKYQFSFQPIRDVYLYSAFNQYQEVKGNLRDVYIFSAVAALLLLIACLNFINLSIARTSIRMQETGVRRVLGAGRMQIILQFLTESLIYFTIASFLAILIYQAFLPAIAKYLGHTLVRTFISEISLFLLAAGAILVVSLFTGIYPAWLLSGFSPANALRGKLFRRGSQGQARLRKSLVVIQFSISIIVIIAMIVVRQQVRFMENTDVGFNKKGLLRISGISWDGKTDITKNAIKEIPGVEQCSVTSFNPSEGGGFMSREVEDPEHPGQKIKIWYILGDIDFSATLGLRLQNGRMLTKDLNTDVANDDSLEQNIILQHSLITASTARILHIKTLNEAGAYIHSCRPISRIWGDAGTGKSRFRTAGCPIIAKNLEENLSR